MSCRWLQSEQPKSTLYLVLMVVVVVVLMVVVVVVVVHLVLMIVVFVVGGGGVLVVVVDVVGVVFVCRATCFVTYKHVTTDQTAIDG